VGALGNSKAGKFEISAKTSDSAPGRDPEKDGENRESAAENVTDFSSAEIGAK
jgi:hypothetical protein